MPFRSLIVVSRAAVQDLSHSAGNQFHFFAQEMPVEKLAHFGTRRLFSQVTDTRAIVTRTGRPPAASGRSVYTGKAFAQYREQPARQNQPESHLKFRARTSKIEALPGTVDQPESGFPSASGCPLPAYRGDYKCGRLPYLWFAKLRRSIDAFS